MDIEKFTVGGAPDVELQAKLGLAGKTVLGFIGSFYAYEPFVQLGVQDASGLRIGLAPYNDDSEIDRLVTALSDFLDR